MVGQSLLVENQTDIYEHITNSYRPIGNPGLKSIIWGLSTWWRSETWRSTSSPQIHQKYIYMRNNSYRTPTKHWQKTSDYPKGKKHPMYIRRAKEKRKKTETKE